MEAPGGGGAVRGIRGWRQALRGPRGGDPRPAREDRGAHGGPGFFSARFGEMSRAERMSAVGAVDGLSLVRQRALAGVSRSSLYYSPAGESAENLALMREIDELHTRYPCYGVRQMRSHLRLGGVVVGVNRVRRLMRLMGLSAVQPPPQTSSPAPGHRVYPYLLGVVESDQAWCADITYIPVMSGFFYLVAVMDWASRRVLSSGARMSMDGRGRFMDIIFIERLWRSLKYEAAYLARARRRTPRPAGSGFLDGLLQPCEAPFRPAWAHARVRLPRWAARAGCRPPRLCWPWPEGNFRP